MRRGLVSVVIPAYGQSRFLAEAIGSVLRQNHSRLEVIVVDDASPDDTEAVVRQSADARVRYIAHTENLGLPEARNSGIRVARGDLVAFLDADDLFHPDKIRLHLDLFDADPSVGAAYNARFELNHSARTIREIWRPPPEVGLSDLILGFPFAPSDMVVRRDWLLRVGLFDARMGSAEDTDLPCRLALEGCRFARVDRALNYRRYHSGRQRKDLPGRLGDVARALDAVFADPRCPADILAIRDRALSHHVMVVTSLALSQGETPLAHSFIEQLVRADPSIVEGDPCELVRFLTMESVADERLDHEQMLGQMFAQLPASLDRLSSQHDWAVARGYLWKGLRAALWERTDEGRHFSERARQRRPRFDEEFVQFVTSHLLNYGQEFGWEAAGAALDRASSCLRLASGRRAAARLSASYLVNRAFEGYRRGDRSVVPGMLARALMSDPTYLANRGVIAMLLRSIGRPPLRSARSSRS